MTKMSGCPSGRLSKAICVPSGDQRGVPVRVPPKWVNWEGERPSESQIQISLLPERLERKAIRLLSGEYCGLESYWVEATIFLGCSRPSRSKRQMLVSSKNCAYAILWPSREKAGSVAFSLTIGTRTGVPPEMGTIHSA